MKALILIAAFFGSAAMATPCIDGAKAWFNEPTANGDHYVQVQRTCVNGSYYDLSNYVYNPKTKCQEGRVQTTTEYDYSVNDHGRLVTQVCVNGKWKTRP